jgi:hypothetical protein
VRKRPNGVPMLRRPINAPWKRRKADAYSTMPRWRQRLSQGWFGIRRQGNINTYMIDPRKNLGGINLKFIYRLVEFIVMTN